jgi:hypothetical protein
MIQIGCHLSCLRLYFCTSEKCVVATNNIGFLLVKLKSSLRKFYGHHHDLVDRYGISELQMTTDMFHLS